MRRLLKFNKSFYIALAVLITLSSVSLGINYFKNNSTDKSGNSVKPVRIGYFQGGRVNMIYRTYINNYFEKEGVNVELYTQNLHGKNFFKISKTKSNKTSSTGKRTYFGRVRGTEIVDKIVAGKFDGGTIGESSFISSINKGLPITAVAMLGYDATPGKGIVIRKDVKINSPNDFKGKTLISRRAGPGDAIFLREFIKNIGLDPKKDLKIIDNVNEDDAEDWLTEKKIDGGLYHLIQIRNLVESKVVKVYRPMDWMDSRLSHAVLVFNNDYLETHREEVQKIVTAYMKRIKYEKQLPTHEKDRSWDIGSMMEGKFQGMTIPRYDFPPRLRLSLLEKMQKLLYKYDYIDDEADINRNIDSTFVENAYEEVK